MPEPRLVAALGDCALGCNLLGDPAELAGSLDGILPVHIRIPGCPPEPQRIAADLLGALQWLRAPASTLGTTINSDLAG
jgi:membrane-bound hydrogenase subunit mbhJ